jgi:hypothetical protein
MQRSEAEAAVKEHLVELAVQHGIAADVQRRISGLGTIIRGYVEMFPELAELVGGVGESPTSEEAPRGAKAVRLVLQETPNEWWLVSALVRELENRGWLPESENPANAVRAALERLIANSDETDIYKHKRSYDGKVEYGYMPDGGVEDPYDYDEEPF